MKLLFGTGNPAKLRAMQERLAGLDVELYGLRDMEKVPEVNEDGRDPMENARIKAEAYWEAWHIPVFSCDSGLYIQELPEELQPGVHVRRPGDHYMTDEEMTEYYSGLARKYGRLTARWQNAVYLILDEDHRYESMADVLSGEAFWITDIPHEKKVEGFPMDRISLVIPGGEYYYDSPIQEEPELSQGFYDFFQYALKDFNH